jgi:signal transduction histidine kinase
LAPPAADTPQASAGSASPDRTAALCEILSQLNRDVPPEESAQVLLPLVVASLGFETGAVLRVGGSEAEVLAAFGRTRKRGFPYPPVDLREPLLVPLTQRSDVAVVAVRHGTALQTPLRALCHPRFRTAVVASAFMGHTLGGLLVLSSPHEWALTEADRAFLSAVADAVGLALGSASLSRATHLSEVVLETAGAVARAISGSLDLAETFSQIAYGAARVMGDCNCLLLAAQDDDQGELVAVACSDPADRVLLGLEVRFKDAAGELETLTGRRAVVVEDLVFGAGTERSLREKLDIRSALFVPIQSEGELIGSLLLYSTGRRDRYSEREIAQAESVAEQAASAICNARVYRDLERSEAQATALLERITRLRERQRLTIANVLHDDVVQSVVAALYQVEGLRAAGGKDTTELDRAAAMLKQTIADARTVIWDLRPAVLDTLGLDRSLEALAQRAAGDGGFEIHTDLGVVPELPPRVSTALYMIAREALQNVRRHASAAHVVLRLEGTDLRAEEGPGSPSQGAAAATDGKRSEIRLSIMDDGVGFEPDEVESGDHFGLTMMDEQAALAGGGLTVTAAVGRGTKVEVLVITNEEG